MHVLTIEELSHVIKKSVWSIRADLRRNPEALPPLFKLPGSRRVLFKDVDSWLEKIAADYLRPDSNQPAQLQQLKRRQRGRPTKAEQLNKSLAINGSASHV